METSKTWKGADLILDDLSTYYIFDKTTQLRIWPFNVKCCGCIFLLEKSNVPTDYWVTLPTAHTYISFVVNREVYVVLPDTVLLTRSIIHNMLATYRSLLMLCLACYHLHLYICFLTCRTHVAKDCYIFHSCIWRREQVICDILSWVRNNLIKDWDVLFIDFDEKCLLTFYNIGNINVNKTSTIIELKVILKIWIGWYTCTPLITF